MNVFIKRNRSIIFAIFIVLCLIGCATQPAPDAFEPIGFWMGIVHSFLMLFNTIGSFFGDVRIYTFPNSGTFYDLGYLLGAMMCLGGTGAGDSIK